MNDMFDDLKSIKSKMKKSETPDVAKKPTKSKDELIKDKESELKESFLNYMKDIEVKKV